MLLLCEAAGVLEDTAAAAAVEMAVGGVRTMTDDGVAVVRTIRAPLRARSDDPRCGSVRNRPSARRLMTKCLDSRDALMHGCAGGLLLQCTAPAAAPGSAPLASGAANRCCCRRRLHTAPSPSTLAPSHLPPSSPVCTLACSCLLSGAALLPPQMPTAFLSCPLPPSALHDDLTCHPPSEKIPPSTS